MVMLPSPFLNGIVLLYEPGGECVLVHIFQSLAVLQVIHVHISRKRVLDEMADKQKAVLKGDAAQHSIGFDRSFSPKIPEIRQ